MRRHRPSATGVWEMKRSTIQWVLLGAAAAAAACSPDRDGDESAGPAGEAGVHAGEGAAGERAGMEARGEAVFRANCAACHQPEGTGVAEVFPPLAQSDFLAGNRREVMQAAQAEIGR